MWTREINKGSRNKGNNKAKGSAMDKSNTRRIFGFVRFRRTEFSPVRFLKRLGRKVAKGLHLMSMRIRLSPPKVTSSSSKRSKPFATHVDSHTNAAIEDCIQFINSSASLPSVSATSK